MQFETRRVAAFIIAAVAGILLLLTGIRGPIGIYQTIKDTLPNLIQDQSILQIVDSIAAIFIVIALAGGLAVIAGGIIILFNHVSVGKLFISVGTGVGLIWLILLSATLLTTLQLSAVLEQYSLFGWIGLILSFIARIMAK